MSFNASKHHTRFVGRASAVTTNSAVASAVLNVSNTLNGFVNVYIDFTKGSLTSVDIAFQLNDGSSSTWNTNTSPGTLNLTADANKVVPVYVGGAKQFRCTVTGNGTVTNSLVALRFGWLDVGGAVG